LHIHRAPAIARQSLLCRRVCPDCARFSYPGPLFVYFGVKTGACFFRRKQKSGTMAGQNDLAKKEG